MKTCATCHQSLSRGGHSRCDDTCCVICRTAEVMRTFRYVSAGMKRWQAKKGQGKG